MAELVNLSELAKRINWRPEEIKEILEKNQGYYNGRIVPRIRFADGKILFPYEEVIEVLPARPLEETKVEVVDDPFIEDETKELPLKKGRSKK